MLAVKSMDLRDNFKTLCDKVFGGETLIVSRPKNENVVMISEKEYNEIMKAARNADYLAKLDRSQEQLQDGNTISFSMDELKDMEKEDWKPTEKVRKFMENCR